MRRQDLSWEPTCSVRNPYEMINMIKLAMDAKVPYQVLGDTIYTHPTMSEAFNDLFAV